MSKLLLLCAAKDSVDDVLPSLALLGHRVTAAPADITALIDIPVVDVVFLDARLDLAGARSLSRLLHSADLDIPLVLVLTEGGLTVVNANWGVDDFVIATASPAEVESRIRFASDKRNAQRLRQDSDDEIQVGELTVDSCGYTARLRGRHLDLTYKEFELLKYLIQHPSRVFTRSQLLQEVWGYDYYGGTRTVDVHVRRLRAKLGIEHEQLIGTVRNVGYRFDPPRDRRSDSHPLGT